MSDEANEPKLSDMQYRIVKPLGTGAGSTIFLIADKNRGGQKFALKVVNRQDSDDDIYIDQAKTEFEVSQKLKHPAIVRIYDCRLKKSFFRVTGVDLLMEYLEGKPLDELQGLDMGQLCLIFDRIASGLVMMHRRGVFHGDMKPSNIMLTKAGQVKLIDLGTAWIKGRDKNRIQGTPQYIAPETITDKVVDERTDIYNFGATMYRMFTGRFANLGPPKPGDNPKNKVVAPMQINPKIPGTLNELIMECLDQNRDKRPTMHEVKGKLEAVVRYLGLSEADLQGPPEDEE
ncbi:MAG: serine/threonine-protein kinase [Isosphaeraceae bacterium]|nr:serine/threonine-protein kinase [Isosphaeraceae bacterium]